MNLSALQDKYVEWLQSAYHYYWGDGTEYMMSDGEWDYFAKLYAANVEHFPLLQKHYYGESDCWSLCTVKQQEFIHELNIILDDGGV
jgi:hypothetical protein